MWKRYKEPLSFCGKTYENDIEEEEKIGWKRRKNGIEPDVWKKIYTQPYFDQNRINHTEKQIFIPEIFSAGLSSLLSFSTFFMDKRPHLESNTSNNQTK